MVHTVPVEALYFLDSEILTEGIVNHQVCSVLYPEMTHGYKRVRRGEETAATPIANANKTKAPCCPASLGLELLGKPTISFICWALIVQRLLSLQRTPAGDCCPCGLSCLSTLQPSIWKPFAELDIVILASTSSAALVESDSSRLDNPNIAVSPVSLSLFLPFRAEAFSIPTVCITLATVLLPTLLAELDVLLPQMFFFSNSLKNASCLQQWRHTVLGS